MAERVSFSALEQNLEQIAIHHADLESGIYEFFSGDSPALVRRYADALRAEARDRSLKELDFTSSLSVLSSVEATIRLDYLKRVYERWRDPLSKKMREIYKGQENKARLVEDLLSAWKATENVKQPVVSAVIAAFRYRNWLAHGRYWTPKLGRAYDYLTVYEIAQEFIEIVESYNDQVSHGMGR